MESIRIIHFSDVLCVWAYAGQGRIDELRSDLGDQVSVDVRFCSVFGDARSKIERGWSNRGGFSGYGAHVRDICDRFENVEAHPDVWRKVQPASSLSCHLFLCAVRHLENEGRLDGAEKPCFLRVCAALREAFFLQLKDISHRAVQLEVAEHLGVPRADLEACLADGSAHAELAADYDLARDYHVKVSPTLILNEDRQRLNGNVSFRVIDANVRELLAQKEAEHASAC
jgi:predicted DsbA family dithiol-disulfide isomerase